MQREHDEEDDEIQEEKRHYDGRSSRITQHRRKKLPKYEDSFTKRLGQRSKSALREQDIERTTASLPTDAPRRTLIDEVSRSSRSTEVNVNPRCCGFPCTGDHNESQKTSRFSKEPPMRSLKFKEPKSLGAVLTRKFFGQSKSVSHPPWENEWAFFREQHELEMKQVREMCVGVQEICQELKRISSHREDTSGVSSRRRSLSEAVSSRVVGAPELGQTKRHGALNFALTRENDHHQRLRRAKSAPRTRVNWDSDLLEEDSEHAGVPNGIFGYPTVALFEEIVQAKRLFLRKFVAALITYDENRFPTNNVDFEQNSNSLRDVVDRLLPRVNFANDWYFKHGIEAWLSRVVFKELDKSEESGGGARARRYAWEEYQRLSLLCPVDAIHRGEDFCKSFHEFCTVKFATIRHQLKWLEVWPDGLVVDFLEASKRVWRAHNLALAFDPIATHFTVKASAKFDVRFMDLLETPTFFRTDSLLASSTHVGFLVHPGYVVLDRIIKCQVCLAPDDRLDSS